MGAIVFSLGKRLWSSLVLVSFVWMTLLPTLVFAEFERAAPAFAKLEHDDELLKALRFHVGYERLDAPDIKKSDTLDSAHYADILRQTSDLFIPTGESFKEVQNSLDLLYTGSGYQGIHIVDKGLAWTAEGYHFHFHESGHLIVSRDTTVEKANRNLRFFNAHGSVVFDDDLNFDTLSLDAQDVVQHGNLRVNKLLAKISGRYSLEGHLAVSELLFEDNLTVDGLPAPKPTFVNTTSGTFEGLGPLTVKGKAVFQNNGTFVSSKATNWSLDGALVNTASMTLAEITVKQGVLFNTGTFEAKGVEGSFKTLVNKENGAISADNFKDVSIEKLLNSKSATLKGDGHLILGGKDELTQDDNPVHNEGIIDAQALSLTLKGKMINSGTLKATQFATDGTGTLDNKGTLNSAHITLDNKHIVHSGTFTGGRLINNSTLLENTGTINVSLWNQGKGQVHNQKNAKLTVEYNTTLSSDLIQNKGELTFKGTLSGRVDTFTNQGKLTTHGKTLLTGGSFLNHSQLNSHAAFTFKGTSFTNNDTGAVIAQQPMRIKTINELDLKGTFILANGGSFTAPKITNNAKIGSKLGKTTFNGMLTNNKTLNVNEFGYEHKTLVNKGTFFANKITSTTLMNEITNTGTFISRSGGFKTKKTFNSYKLALGMGTYELGVLENKAGATFQVEKGMDGKVTDIINNGEIITRTSIILDSLKGMTKLGIVKATENIILKSTHIAKEVDWMDEFLWDNKHNLQVGRKIIVETERFVNRKQFTRPWNLPLSDVSPYRSIPYHVEFRVTDFENYGALTTRGLTIRSRTFKNGLNNEKMKVTETYSWGNVTRYNGTIHVYGVMDILVDGHVDNRFGDISVGAYAGGEPSRIKSWTGQIINGYFQEIDKTKYITLSNSDKTPTWRDFSIHNHGFLERHKIRNGAKIVARNKLILEAFDDIDNEFGLIYGFYADEGTDISQLREGEVIEVGARPKIGLTLRTPKTVRNKSGHILSGSHIKIVAHRLENTIGEGVKPDPNNPKDPKDNNGYWGKFVYDEDPRSRIPFRGSNWERVNEMWRFYHQSDSGRIESLNGNIYLSLAEGDNTGGYIKSHKIIELNNLEHHSSTSLPSWFKNGIGRNFNTYRGGNYKQYLPFFEFGEEKFGDFLAGQQVNITWNGLFDLLNGRINAPTVNVSVFDYTAAAEHRTAPYQQTRNRVIDAGNAANDHLSNNPLITNHNGTRQAQILGGENPSRPIPSFNPRTSEPPQFSKITLQMLCSFLFGTHCGTLNVYGKSGYSLIESLFDNGESIINRVIRLKNTTMMNTNMANILENCLNNEEEGAILEDPNGQVKFLITPNMVVKTLNQLGTISGNHVNVKVKNKANIDGAGFSAYAPYVPSQDRTINTDRPSLEVPTNATKADPLPDRVELQPEAPKATLNLDFGDLNAQAMNISSDGSTNVHAKSASIRSKTHRSNTTSGFQEVSERSTFFSDGPLNVAIDHDLYLQNIQAESNTSMLFDVTGNIFDLPLILHGAHTTHEQTKRGHKTTTTTHTSTAETSTYTCKGAVVFKSNGHIDVHATKVRAEVLQFLAGTGVTIHDVHNTVSTTTEEFSKGKGWFGKDTTLNSMHQVMKSVGADFGDTPTEIILGQQGLVDITNITVDNLTIDPKGGTIRFNLGKNFESLSQSKKSSSAFWQTQSMSQESHQTGTQSRIGNLKVISTADTPIKITIEQVRGQTAEFIKRIEMDHGQVTETFWDEVHEEMHKSTRGPTAATAALIAIAVAATTYGTGLGASVGGSMATSMGLTNTTMVATAMGTIPVVKLTVMGSAAATMFSAGFTSLATSAVMSLANNEGDPRKAVKAFANKDTFQSLGMSMLSAGLTYGALDALGLATDITKVTTIASHAANQSVNMGVRMALDTATTGRTDGVAAGLTAIAGTIGGYLSTKIGQWYAKTPKSFEACLSHKIQHFVSGAGQGLIMGLADKDGEGLGKIIAGAAGAVAAEVYADFAMPTGGSALPGAEGSGLSKADHAVKIRQTQAAARFMAGATAAALGMSAEQIGVAMVTANIALDHNFAPSALNHLGVATDTKDEIIDENTLQKEASEKGVSKSEQDIVRTKLNELAQANLGDGKTLADNINVMPTSFEDIESTQKTLVKGYVQKIATVNQNLHQLLNEHPWARETLTSSMNLFGNCVRAMLYIDMATLGAAGGTGLCVAGGVKNAAGLRACAVLGGLTGGAVNALSIEPTIQAAINEGVKILSNGAAERFGDTPADKAAIRQLVGDTADVAGLLAGAGYLKYRAANPLNYGGGVTFEESKPISAINKDQKLLWESWSNYKKSFIGENEYAQIGDRFYTKHAVDRMQPSGFGSPAGSIGSGRSFPPSFVEDVINNGTRTNVSINGTKRVIHSLGTAEVVTESGGNIVVTVNPFRGK